MKKVLIAILCAVVAILIAGTIGHRGYSQTEYMLNTVITITADDKDAVAQCFDEIRRIENLLSVYIPDSEISAINSAPAGTPVKVSDETFGLLKKAQEYKALTNGAFDITVKPLVDLWDVSGEGYVPEDEEIIAALELIDNIIFDDENCTVTLPKSGMAIDLGGIAKGYAGDKVREILIAHDIDSAIADLGGNIVTIGKNGRKDWRIGLQNPTAQRGTTFAEINANDKFVVTSGGYERYFEKDGQVYHHIFDPKTGKNPSNGILSVTVVSEDGALADALSTACFVMGKDKAIATAEKCGAELAIYMKNEVFYTNGIIHMEDK